MAKSGFNPIGGVTKVVPAVSPGSEISLNAATAPGRGTESIGGSVRSVADLTLGEFVKRSAHARTRGTLVEADSAMINTETEFEVWKQTNSDETTWAAKWKELTDGVDKTFAEKKITLAGRDALDTKLTAWKERSSGRVQAQEATATNSRAKTQMETGANEAYRRGAFEVGDAYIADALEAGLMSKQEASQITSEGRNVADVALAEQTILNDPATAVETLKDEDYLKSLFPEQRRALENRAKVAYKKQQTETLNRLQERILVGDIIPKTEFDEAVETKQITATQSKYLQDQQVSSDTYAGNLVKASKILNDIDSYKVGGGSDELTTASIANEIAVMPKIFRDKLANQLLAQEKDDNKVNPDAKAAIKVKFDLGLFGETGKYTKALAGDQASLVGQPIDAEATERAYRTMYETRDALERFAVNNPDSTLADQLDFIDDYTSSITEPIEAEEILQEGNFFLDFLFAPTAISRLINREEE